MGTPKKAQKTPKKMKKGIAVAGVVLLILVLAFAFGYERIQKAQHPLQYAQEVEHWAREFGVDPYLVYAVIHTESGFDAQAVSSADARGLMQMTRDTFAWIKSKIAAEEPLVFEDVFTPDVSVRFGVYFLSLCLARYENDVPTAAAAYHSGWTTVDNLLDQAEYSTNGTTLVQFPYRQMAHYVHKIETRYQEYLQLYSQ